jgi:pentapeptide MXKDX repeat protein
MSQRFQFVLLALLALGASPLAAQQDKMQHDEMKKDAMGKGDAMGKDDAMAMDHGMAMLPHGTFSGTDGHKAGGSFSLASEGGKTVLKLGTDFWADTGPDVNVALSSGPTVSEGAVFLGKLSKGSGAQTFEVPAGTDLRRFSHVVLWSKKDKAAYGDASLAGDDAMMHK